VAYDINHAARKGGQRLMSANKHDTSKRQRGSTKPSPSVQDARKILGVEPIKEDHETARLLLALYHNKKTPEMFKHLIFQVFWDGVHFYNISLPKNFTSKWRPYWPLLVAKLRVQGQMPTSIRYTWQPTPEEEAALDAEEEEDNYLRHVFQLAHDPKLPAGAHDRIAGEITSILDEARPDRDFEVFRVAFPRALAALAAKAEEGGADDE
jgi:hypothetical protein